MDESDSVFFLAAFFSGHVQGVGFRYSTSQVAKGYEVTGFVRNLMDGRVELEVEGAEGECRAFLRAVEEELDAYIRKVELSVGRRGASFKGFRIA